MLGHFFKLLCREHHKPRFVVFPTDTGNTLLCQRVSMSFSFHITATILTHTEPINDFYSTNMKSNFFKEN